MNFMAVLKTIVAIIIFCVVVALLATSSYYARVVQVRWTTDIATDQINQNQQQQQVQQ